MKKEAKGFGCLQMKSREALCHTNSVWMDMAACEGDEAGLFVRNALERQLF